MKYFRIRNWEKFQHYKRRNPPWIKLHVLFLDDWAISNLTPRNQILLVRLWLIASRTENLLQDDQHWLKFHTKLKGVISLKPLEKALFIEYIEKRASTPLASCKQSATPESETEKKTKRISKEEHKIAGSPQREHPYGSDDFETKRKIAQGLARKLADKMKSI